MEEQIESRAGVPSKQNEPIPTAVQWYNSKATPLKDYNFSKESNDEGYQLFHAWSNELIILQEIMSNEVSFFNV